MNMLRNRHCTAFAGTRLIVSGDLEGVALATKQVVDSGELAPILIFDDESNLVELDLRGPVKTLLQRIREAQAADPGTDNDDIIGKPSADATKQEHAPSSKTSRPQGQPRGTASTGPGRPKLGVVAREVTLLPRHWEWLNGQPGGASVTLRKLVDNARKQTESVDRVRKAREATYRFMSAMAGNESGFEEATRALFAGDSERFRQHVHSWPADVRNHATTLAVTAFSE